MGQIKTRMCFFSRKFEFLFVVFCVLVLGGKPLLWADTQGENQSEQHSIEEQLRANFQGVEESIEGLKEKNASLLEHNNQLRQQILDLHDKNKKENQNTKEPLNVLGESAERLESIQNDLASHAARLREIDSSLEERIQLLSQELLALKKNSESQSQSSRKSSPRKINKTNSVKDQQSRKKLQQSGEDLLRIQQEISSLIVQKESVIQTKESLEQKKVTGLTLFDQEIRDLKIKTDALSHLPAFSQPSPAIASQSIPKNNREIQKKINTLKKKNESLEQETLLLMQKTASLDRKKNKHLQRLKNNSGNPVK